jgi:hypothetical protein
MLDVEEAVLGGVFLKHTLLCCDGVALPREFVITGEARV